MKEAPSSPEDYMRLALEEARRAFDEGEVPVGAVVVAGGKIVGCGRNMVERRTDATLHAEMVALQEASTALKRWRLNDVELYVTLEPCPMCVGAMVLARVSKVYFGCFDPRQGAMGSVFDISAHPKLPHAIEVIPEVLEDECRLLLQSFFQKLR